MKLTPMILAVSLCLTATRAASQMQDVLDAHNTYRAKHCVPKLAWSEQVAASAQQWADRCVFEHQKGSGYGENLAWGSSPNSAVARWYNEISKYNYSNPGFSMKTGHFTQVVWRGSKEVGGGMAICKGQNFLVCRYSPPGNVSSQFPTNVPKACG